MLFFAKVVVLVLCGLPLNSASDVIFGNCEILDLTMRMPTLNADPSQLFPVPVPSLDKTNPTVYPNNSDYFTTMMITSSYTEKSGMASGAVSIWNLVKVAMVLDFSSEVVGVRSFLITTEHVERKLAEMHDTSLDQLDPNKYVIILYTGWARKIRTASYLDYQSTGLTNGDTKNTEMTTRSGFPVVCSNLTRIISKMQIGLMMDFPSLDSWPSTFNSTKQIFSSDQNPFIVNLNMTSYPINPSKMILFFYPLKQRHNQFSPVRVVAIGFGKNDPCRYGANPNRRIICGEGHKETWPISGIVGLALFPSLLIIVCLIMKLQTWRQQHGYI